MLRGTREDRSTLKILVMSGFESQLPVCQASALSIALCPQAKIVKLINNHLGNIFLAILVQLNFLVLTFWTALSYSWANW